MIKIAGRPTFNDADRRSLSSWVTGSAGRPPAAVFAEGSGDSAASSFGRRRRATNNAFARRPRDTRALAGWPAAALRVAPWLLLPARYIARSSPTLSDTSLYFRDQNSWTRTATASRPTICAASPTVVRAAAVTCCACISSSDTTRTYGSSAGAEQDAPSAECRTRAGRPLNDRLAGASSFVSLHRVEGAKRTPPVS